MKIIELDDKDLKLLEKLQYKLNHAIVIKNLPFFGDITLNEQKNNPTLKVLAKILN